MTLYTIIYNYYGPFLTGWLENAQNQTIKFDKIIVVLGKNHGVDITKHIGVEFIESESETMGTLRNLAMSVIDTEWALYFSVDDILYPDAVETLKKYSKYDAVALSYEDVYNSYKSLERQSAIFTLDNMEKWQDIYKIPGYIAVRTNINGVRPLYEEIEIPNYPYLFQLAKIGAKQIQTSEIIAMYRRRRKSHGDKSQRTGKFRDYAKYIDERAIYYKELN